MEIIQLEKIKLDLELLSPTINIMINLVDNYIQIKKNIMDRDYTIKELINELENIKMDNKEIKIELETLKLNDINFNNVSLLKHKDKIVNELQNEIIYLKKQISKYTANQNSNVNEILVPNNIEIISSNDDNIYKSNNTTEPIKRTRKPKIASNDDNISKSNNIIEPIKRSRKLKFAATVDNIYESPNIIEPIKTSQDYIINNNSNDVINDNTNDVINNNSYDANKVDNILLSYDEPININEQIPQPPDDIDDMDIKTIDKVKYWLYKGLLYQYINSTTVGTFIRKLPLR